MSIIDARLRERAATAPGSVALVTHLGGKERVWSWAELERATAPIADRSARAARERPAVLVAVAAAVPEHLLRLIGVLRTRVPVAVVSPTAPVGERAALREELLRAGHRPIEDGAGPAGRRGDPPRTRIPPESLLIGTGGSTGRPKIVIDTWTRTVARRPRPTRPSTATNWRPGQRQLVVGPLHHAAGLTFFVEGLSDGNCLVLPPAAAPATTLEVAGGWRVEWLHLTPYHMRQLAAVPGCRERLSSLRGMLHLAAPCARPLKRRWLDVVGPERVFEMYGATEGIGVTIARGDEWLRRPGTVGRGFFTQIRILDERGRALPPGQIGDVYMRSGGSRRYAYLGRDDLGARTIDNFATVGDRGQVDSEGYLYLTARQARRIQVGGETVNPSEVEYVLLEHPGVLDAAVFGVPDDRLGESVAALVVPGRDPDTRSLRDHLRRRLARYKVPRTIRYVTQLPRTETGKLDRARLASTDVASRLSSGES